MSNYTKATNFATKDTLPTGNAGKIVKGTEIDDEFNAIASAISSKANSESPSLTGSPTVPTATSGSNTTQAANTAFVTAAISTATSSLGTMSTQAASAVAITGGTISGVAITTGSINALTTASLGTMAYGTRTVSTSSPTGGSNGDVWFKV
jgi:hypothetical protein